MIEVSVPKDIFKYKAKITGNFTTREVGFMSLGVALVFILWFSLPASWIFVPKCIICVIPMLFCFLIGFVTIQNEPVEQILPRIINDNYLCKRNRTKEICFEAKKPTIISVKESKSYRKVK